MTSQDKPGGISWCDYTWNPVTGCNHGCPYCYARGISMRFQGHFKPEFHADRLREPEEKARPLHIFVCSMADLFGAWVPNEWIFSVANACFEAKQHRYMLLTKNPSRYLTSPAFPSGTLFGRTLTGTGENTGDERQIFSKVDFISFEPLLYDNIVDGMINPSLKFVIVGPQTGPGAKPMPKKAVEYIKRECAKYSIPIHWKKGGKA